MFANNRCLCFRIVVFPIRFIVRHTNDKWFAKWPSIRQHILRNVAIRSIHPSIPFIGAGVIARRFASYLAVRRCTQFTVLVVSIYRSGAIFTHFCGFVAAFDLNMKRLRNDMSYEYLASKNCQLISFTRTPTQWNIFSLSALELLRLPHEFSSNISILWSPKTPHSRHCDNKFDLRVLCIWIWKYLRIQIRFSVLRLCCSLT